MLKQIKFLSLLFICFCSIARAQRNPYTGSHTQVFIKTKPLPFRADSLKNQSGAYTFHNKLISPANLLPHNTWIRMEGPVWENDIIGYRFYLDKRNRFDIFGKRIKDLVLDTVAQDYHPVLHWGTDVLKVNESLGLGTPAFYKEGKILLMDSVQEKICTIIKDKNAAKLKMEYNGVWLDGFTTNITILLTLKKGERHTTVELQSKPGLPANIQIATGFVQHKAAEHIYYTSNNQSFLYSYGQQSFHDQELGLAVAVPYNNAKYLSAQQSHILYWPHMKGKTRYAFAACWQMEPMALQSPQFKNYVNSIRF